LLILPEEEWKSYALLLPGGGWCGRLYASCICREGRDRTGLVKVRTTVERVEEGGAGSGHVAQWYRFVWFVWVRG
jgi:hypothetical protein